MFHLKVYGWCKVSRGYNIYNYSKFDYKKDVMVFWVEREPIIEYTYCFLYWAIYVINHLKSQVFNVITNVKTSGYMSESRGLHWDRKSRCGVK